MELYEIERALTLFLRMIQNHPELCPHDYCFEYERDNIQYFRCNLCGHTKNEPRPLSYWELQNRKGDENGKRNS